MSDPIVFIDDEAALCRLFSLVLERHLGRAVVAFTDPVAAVEYLGRERACVVVCDFRMPGLTGLEVLQRLPDDVPFVLISGDLDAADDVADRQRVTAFLPKPLRPEELLAALRPFVVL